MNKNDLTGIIGMGVIAIAFGICAAYILPISLFFGILLILLAAFLGLGTIVSLFGAFEKPKSVEASEESEEA